MKTHRHSEPDLNALVSNLVRHAYPELVDRLIRARWGRLASFAEIRWGSPPEEISLVCERIARRWHECALVGLLAHELSHPCVSTGRRTEERTDLETVERGLGVYLTAERAVTGQYLDQVVGKGRDRYLGYQSLRERLTQHEIGQLDRLLDSLRIVPSSSAIFPASKIHDTAIGNGPQASVGGYVFQGVSIPPESNVKLLIKEHSVFLYIDDQLAGETPTDWLD